MDITHQNATALPTKKHNRLYAVEFLRLLFISGIVFGHITQNICPSLKDSFCQIFHTKSHMLWFGVDGFFIIAGFFLYRSMVACKSSAFEHIKKIWIRLIPSLLFAFTILVCLGICPWWQAFELLFLIPGTGLARELIGNSEWFLCVYFLLCAFIIGLFNYSSKLAWIIVGVLAYFALSLQHHAHPVKFANVIDMVYYTLITNGICKGIVCMALGLGAAFISHNITFYKGSLFRVAMTCFEASGFYVLFNYMFRTSCFRYSPLDVELILSLLLISISHSCGYISATFNQMRWIQFMSRYTYPFLIGHAIMIKCLRSLPVSLTVDNKALWLQGAFCWELLNII